MRRAAPAQTSEDGVYKQCLASSHRNVGLCLNLLIEYHFATLLVAQSNEIRVFQAGGFLLITISLRKILSFKMKTSSILAIIATASVTIAEPTARSAGSSVTDLLSVGGNALRIAIEPLDSGGDQVFQFSSTQVVKATPDQVVNGTTPTGKQLWIRFSPL